ELVKDLGASPLYYFSDVYENSILGLYNMWREVEDPVPMYLYEVTVTGLKVYDGALALTVDIDGMTYNGSIQVSITKASTGGGGGGTVIKDKPDPPTEKTTPDTPPAPTVESKTHNSVTLTFVAGYQYSKDGTTWQNSNIFSNLEPDTEYTFYQRVRETSDALASASSPGTVVTTEPEPSDGGLSIVAIAIIAIIIIAGICAVVWYFFLRKDRGGA
ncbi:MAG: hypothetical protein FWG41_06610, partial [Methanomassiliicoccaceae archaeon]|nr:hypothetical protein [Methanomassiliicoccaceae archaeon]